MKSFGEKEINAMQDFVSANRSTYHIKFQQNKRQFYWQMGVAVFISWILALIGSFFVVFISRGRDFDWVEVLIGSIPFFIFIYFLFAQGFIYLLLTLSDMVNALNIYDQYSVKRKISLVVFLRALFAALLPIFCIFPGILLVFPLMYLHRSQYTLWGIVDGYGLIDSIKKSFLISKEILLTEIFTGKFAGDLHLAQAYVWRYYFPKK